MSAAATALVQTQRRIVTVRLADAAIAVASVSVVFTLLLLLFPESFPRIIVKIWERGNLPLFVAGFTFVLDLIIYLRIAYKLSAKPGILGAMVLGALPLMVVVGCSLLLQQAVHLILIQDLPNLRARIGEEVLAQTYLSLISAVFLPFLVIRLLQQFKATHR